MEGGDWCTEGVVYLFPGDTHALGINRSETGCGSIAYVAVIAVSVY